MQTNRLELWLVVIAVALAMAGQLYASDDAQSQGPRTIHGDIGLKQDGVRSASSAVGITCKQIVVNPKLDIVEFGSDRGSAEPWIFIDPIIYYVKEAGGSFDGYSLVLPDGDAGDPSPKGDSLGQIVYFMYGLESATISYQRAMLDANPQDNVYGELWLLTEDGEIDLADPGKYRLARWQVTDSNGTWAKHVVELEASVIGQLRGQEIGFLLRTETNGGGASDAEKEWVLFDDVEISVCGRFGVILLPVVLRK